MTPSGVRGVLNDVLSIYFLDATLVTAFVARRCAGGYKIEAAEVVFRVPAERRPSAVRQRSSNQVVREMALLV